MLVAGPDVAAWVYEPLGGAVNESSSAIGWINTEGKLVSAVAIEGWNGVNAYCHQRHEGTPASRKFWFAVVDWAFNELGCKRLTGPVAGSNEKAIKLNEHIGFEHEATLKCAAYDGSDLHLMVLWRENCRMLDWGKK